MSWKIFLIVLKIIINPNYEPPTIESPLPIEVISMSTEQEIIATTSLTIAKKVNETIPIDNIACYCAKWARLQGVNIPIASAKDLKASSTPQIGGGILFAYNNATKIEDFHIAIIKKFMTNGFWVKEANFFPCRISERFVLYNDFHIRGFVDKK